MLTQSEKGKVFRDLHHRDGAFIIPNPWDIGSARLLAGLGFEALATTSAGYAFSLGQLDNTVGRAVMMSHISAIAKATELPVSGDLENGFGDSPETVAQTIRLGAAAGLVGGSIEDASGHVDKPIYEMNQASERIQAAAEAARSLPFSFTLTARVENYLHGRPDLKDTIFRLRVYQEAGADVLYAPGLTSKEEIAAVVSSVDRPVNVLAGLQGDRFTRSMLSRLGVKRISVGSALYRTSLGAFLRAGQIMRKRGTFAFAHGVPYKELSEMFKLWESAGEHQHDLQSSALRRAE